jgi:hypothetical protein
LEWDAGHVTEFVLVFSARDICFLMDRGQTLLPHSSLFLPAKRIKYLDPSTGKMTGPAFGSLVLYAGPNQTRFAREFGGHGTILRPASPLFLQFARRAK